jgi:hypothetical protein
MKSQLPSILNYEDLPIVMNIDDLRKVLKMSKPAIYALMDQPSFGTFKVGRCKRVTRDAFIKWLESHSAKQN